jgi:hypothetical protein
MQILGIQLVLTGLGMIVPLAMSLAGKSGAVFGGVLLVLLNALAMFRGARSAGGLAAWYRRTVPAHETSPWMTLFAGLGFLVGGLYFAVLGEPGNGPNPMDRVQIIIFSSAFILMGSGMLCLGLIGPDHRSK